MNDTYLKQKKSTVVFKNIPFDNNELLYKFKKFLTQLQNNTELHMILVMNEERANDEMFRSHRLVKMNFMERSEAIEFLRRILYIERKTELFRGDKLENHKVIEMWGKMNFADNEAFSIAHLLSKNMRLIDIANDMERRLTIKGIDQSQQQVGLETTLGSLSIVTLMVRSSEKLLNDLIIFLTVCPNGLGLTEVEIVLSMFPSDLAPSEKAKQIKLYIDMFKEVSQNKEGGEHTNFESGSELSNELQERHSELFQVIRSLLFFETQEEPYAETIVKLQMNERPALEFIVKSNSQIKERIADISSQQLLKTALDFFVPYLKYLLFKIRDQRQNSYADHRFISASLFMGMWQKITVRTEFDDFRVIDQNFDSRFLAIRQNVFHLLKRETSEQLVPNLTLKSIDQSVSDEDKCLLVTFVNDLRELSLVAPMILARLDMPQVAIIFLDQAR